MSSLNSAVSTLSLWWPASGVQFAFVGYVHQIYGNLKGFQIYFPFEMIPKGRSLF